MSNMWYNASYIYKSSLDEKFSCHTKKKNIWKENIDSCYNFWRISSKWLAKSGALRLDLPLCSNI